MKYLSYLSCSLVLVLQITTGAWASPLPDCGPDSCDFIESQGWAIGCSYVTTQVTNVLTMAVGPTSPPVINPLVMSGCLCNVEGASVTPDDVWVECNFTE